tara:strand:+ start:1402 stop:2013 length:612 start_codon:yes stop_codon:yes gene_type:complete
MEWDSFFETNDRNKWPDNEIIKHFSRLIKNKNIDENDYEIFDFGRESGNNVKLFLNFCRKINCIDISKNALDKLRNFYNVLYSKSLLNLIHTNLEKDDLSFLDKSNNNLNKIYVDCTCFQHIDIEAFKNILCKFRDNSNNKNSYLISKSLCYESKNISFRTNINNRDKLIDLFSSYGLIAEKTYSIIEEDFIRQEFLTITVSL